MSSSNTTHLIPVFGRLFWMMVGPMALLMTTYFILVPATVGQQWPTFYSLPSLAA